MYCKLFTYEQKNNQSMFAFSLLIGLLYVESFVDSKQASIRCTFFLFVDVLECR